MVENPSLFQAPFPPYDPLDKNGFSFETVVKRWPIIITNIIDNINRILHDVTMNPPKDESDSGDAKIKEGQQIISSLSKLKYEMGRDRPLIEIPADGEALTELYNKELAALAQARKNTWFTAPWLFAECYLYRFFRSFFTQTEHWKWHDPFYASKEDSFKGSSLAVYQLGKTMEEMYATRDEFLSKPEKVEVFFQQMIQMSLWGNATDLSLLTNLTHEDIRKLQSVGHEEQEKRRQFILKDDSQKAWDHLKTLKDARVDFVLDNSGFEVFTDLIFADFFVSCTPFVSKIVFHPKAIPWFVSDVTPPDFSKILDSLLDPSFFPPSASPDPSTTQSLHNMTHRWKSYVQSGVFQLSSAISTSDSPKASEVPRLGMSSSLLDFWTTPWPYWNMNILAPELFEYFKESGLVIFKGDLNYRKLTGDVQWPVSTPFESALGPLAGSFPILSLRTNKADVVVGVDQAVADELDARGEKWRVNGKYALVSFVPRV